MPADRRPSKRRASESAKRQIRDQRRRGQLIDVKIPGGDVAADAVRQVLRAFSANLPVSTIGVGETVTTPLEFTLPLPNPDGTGMKIQP